jgi:DNA invertase Pin-like site-specific DNA recombinase
VSSDERLDQTFNSIDAQKEAGHAYIASQRNEGWIPVVDDYDDGGFSGGNMERPGLRRLLADIEDGRIDIVVVYKIDRMTRSLADFSKMVEVFERIGVSFVSVTQQFNTTTSMGRLMLNVLLSFAQFEREVTGERIRDKITASKRKGMWMGGIPPLGYDVKDRRLIPNEREARVIQHIFKRFVELGSSTKLVKELRLDGVTSKAWITQDGNVRNGKLIDKSLIYKLLGNRTYLGELRHKDEWFKGEHQPLIEPSTWNAVQSVLKISPRMRGNYTRATVPFLLKGIVEGADGRALTAAWTRKGAGKLYRYYIHTRENKEHAGASGLPRFPAIELEANVVAQLRRILCAPDLKTGVAQFMTARNSQVDEAKVCIAMLQIDKIWDQLFPVEQERIVRLLITKVVVTATNIVLQFRPNGIERLAAELRLSVVEEDSAEVVA